MMPRRVLQLLLAQLLPKKTAPPLPAAERDPAMSSIRQERRRGYQVQVAVSVTAAAEYPAVGVHCASCGTLTELQSMWIIPAGYIICNCCAVPVLRADLERRLELLAVAEASKELRAIAIPVELRQPAMQKVEL
jgi:hypothetical protein